MRRASTLALTAALAISGLAMNPNETPETPDSTPYVPVIETERTYAHCGDTEKVSNVEGGSPFSSDTNEPAASFQEGAGCGTADVVLTEPVEQDAGEFLQFTAEHTGNLDALTLELHMIDAGIVRVSETAPTGEVPNPGDPVPTVAFDEIYADTELYISTADGTPVAGYLGEARYPSERSSTGLSTRLRLTLTDIGLLAEDEFATYTVTVKVKTADYYNGDSGGWVLDASEVPTGITFNPVEADWAPYQETSTSFG